MCAYPRQPSNISYDPEYERLLHDAISAAKRGNKTLANTLLERAIRLHPSDARPWMWLSATTDDPAERRKYLEYAVAADPGNVAARRGLALLAGKVDQSRLVENPDAPDVRRPAGEIEEAQAQTYACPKCGGRMAFDVQQSDLACSYCGYVKETEKRLASDSAEQVMDFIMPTTRAYGWAQSQQRAECSACGAITMLPPGQTADRCANCGSNRFVQSRQVMELIDPQVMALPRIDAKEAAKRARQWLGKGIFAPDDLLLKASGGLHLMPAYYPFWTFDGTLEVNWSCEVNVGSNNRTEWEHISGAEYEIFDDVLIPGLRKMSISEVRDIEPFNLKDLVEFKPDYLAGWSALTYDAPLSEASNRAQGRIRERVTRFLAMKVAAGRQIRNLQTGGGKWVDMTYKHILLPLYVGNYHYKGKAFRIYVNGQTGKASGEKPHDWVKAALATAMGILLLALIIFVLYTILSRMA